MLSRKKRVAFGEPKTHSEHWIYSSRFVVLLGFSVAASVDAVWRVDHNRPRLPYRESVSSMTPRHLSSLGSRMNHDDVMVRQCRSRLARIAAGVCDLVFVGSLDAFVLLLTTGLAGLNRFESLPIAPFFTFLLLLNTDYVVVPTVVGEQTKGKMIFSLRVVDRNGGLVSLGAALVRLSYTMISLGLFGFCVLWMFMDTECCAWHDRLSGTRVVTA